MSAEEVPFAPHELPFEQVWDIVHRQKGELRAAEERAEWLREALEGLLPVRCNDLAAGLRIETRIRVALAADDAARGGR